MSGAGDWDDRYSTGDLVWSADANRFIVDVCTSLPVGRALDLAAGEGRNSIWLASLGWQVTAVDFSQVALDRGRRLAGDRGPEVSERITWVAADLAHYRPASHAFDLVVIAYLQVPAPLRHAAVVAAAAALAPGGRLVVVAHDRSNLVDGVGGPQDPDVLYGTADVAADLDGTGLTVTRSEQVRRPVGDREAIDLLVTAERPETSG